MRDVDVGSVAVAAAAVDRYMDASSMYVWMDDDDDDDDEGMRGGREEAPGAAAAGQQQHQRVPFDRARGRRVLCRCGDQSLSAIG